MSTLRTRMARLVLATATTVGLTLASATTALASGGTWSG